MHVCGGTHVANMPWDRAITGEFINDLIDLDFGFITYLALLNLWVWVDVEGFMDC